MNDIVEPEHVELARRFRALSSAYESNRDLVLMGAYRPGADALVDRAIAMHKPLTELLCQPTGQLIPLERSQSDLVQLLGHEG
jgi:flagellum-specific ATP synthase